MNVTPLVLSLAAVAVAGVSAYGVQGRLARQQAELQELRAALEDRPRPAPASPRHTGAARGREDAIAALESRVARLESQGSRQPVAASVEAAAPAPSDPSGEDRAAESLSPEEQEARREMLELLALFEGGFDWDGDAESLQRFYELARETDVIDERIAELEADVEAAPQDTAGRMLLADTYVAKLMTLQGPEQGLWGMKAESQWKEVVELDPGHWQATFNIGNNYAYYPDVMGKTDDAIAYLDRAREIQEESTQGDEQARTYLSLARMHQRKGDLDEARRVLEEGLRYHPGNAGLEAALASLD